MTGFEELAHGRYLIKTGPRGQLWQARAYLGNRQVGDNVVADDRETALTKLRKYLDGRDTEVEAGRGADGSPSALEYAEAFDRLGRLAPGYEAMLDAHLRATDQLITAPQLAEAAGYANWSAANLHYGTLGRRLADEMGYNPPKRENGTPIWTYTLATAAGEGELEREQLIASFERYIEDPHFEWLLRPQVIEALQGRN